MNNARFAYRNFGRWQEKARGHGAYGSRYPVEVSDDHGRVTRAVLICPDQPSRASLQFGRYARLDASAKRPVRIHILDEGWAWIDPSGSRVSRRSVA